MCARFLALNLSSRLTRLLRGLGSWGARGGGLVSESVFSDNLKQQDQPLFGVLALVSEGVGGTDKVASQEVAAGVALPKLDCVERGWMLR